MIESPTVNGKVKNLRFGKDHLCLAEWRLSIPSQVRNAPGLIETSFERKEGTLQRVVLESGAVTSFPTNEDDLYIIGVLSIAKTQEFPPIVKFHLSDLLQLLRLPNERRYRARAKLAFHRFRTLTASFEGTWFNRADNRTTAEFHTGIIAEAKIEPDKRGGRSKSAAHRCHVQWTDNFHQSILDGNLIDVDLDLLCSWKRPSTTSLFRHLNKVWHAGRKPFRYSRDLNEMACGHLNLTDCKDLKRNFHALVAEMEDRGYLIQMDQNERYDKIRRGIYRVHFELSPDFYWNKSRESSQVSFSQGAKLLVEQFHKLRFGVDLYVPKKHELTKAEILISDFSLDELLNVTDRVVVAVRSGPGDDLFFGFAEPHYRRILDQERGSKLERDKQLVNHKTAASEQSTAIQLETKAKHEHDDRLQRYLALDVEQKKILRERALLAAHSNAEYKRIAASDIVSPPSDVLKALMKHLPAISA